MTDEKQVFFYGTLDELNEDDLITAQGMKYQVVFYGEVMPGSDLELVKKNLAKAFKVDRSRINPLFSGKKQVIKKGVSREVCEKAKNMLEAAGAVCAVVPQRDHDRQEAFDSPRTEPDLGLNDDNDIERLLNMTWPEAAIKKRGRRRAYSALALVSITAMIVLYFLLTSHDDPIRNAFVKSDTKERTAAVRTMPITPPPQQKTALPEKEPEEKGLARQDELPAAAQKDPTEPAVPAETIVAADHATAQDLPKNDTPPDKSLIEETDTQEADGSDAKPDAAMTTTGKEPVDPATTVEESIDPVPSAGMIKKKPGEPEAVAEEPAETIAPAGVRILSEPKIAAKDRVGAARATPAVVRGTDPDMPVGSIKDLDFKANQVLLKNGVLHLRQTDDRQIIIFLFLDNVFLVNPDDISEKEFIVTSTTPEKDTPHIHLSLGTRGEKTPRTDIIMENYKMRLTFKTIRDHSLAGHIDLTVPGEEKTRVAGPFTATVEDRAGR